MKRTAAGFASCDACGRHVRAGEATCPFCSGRVAAAPRSFDLTPGIRPMRAALLAGAAAAWVTGCHDGDPAATTPPATDAPFVVPPSAMPVDSGVAAVSPSRIDAAAAPVDTPDDATDARNAGRLHGHPVMAPLYGAPPPHRLDPTPTK